MQGMQAAEILSCHRRSNPRLYTSAYEVEPQKQIAAETAATPTIKMVTMLLANSLSSFRARVVKVSARKFWAQANETLMPTPQKMPKGEIRRDLLRPAGPVERRAACIGPSGCRFLRRLRSDPTRPLTKAKSVCWVSWEPVSGPAPSPPEGGFLKIISVGIPTYAGMKTGFYADFRFTIVINNYADFFHPWY